MMDDLTIQPETVAPSVPAMTGETVSRQDYETLKSELDSAKKWQADAMDAFQGVMLAKSSPYQALPPTMAGPAPGFPMMSLAQGPPMGDSTNHMMQLMEYRQGLRQEFSQKYPDLAAFEDYIVNEAQRQAQKLQYISQPVDDRTLVEAIIQDLRTKLQGVEKYRQQQQIKAQSLQLNASGSQPVQQKPIDQMSWEEFDAYERQVAQKLRERNR